MNDRTARLLRSGGPLLGLAVTWLLFATTAGGSFTNWANHELMLLQTAVVGIAAIGACWIIVGGGIDLSVGSSVAVGTMVGALVLRAGAPWPVAALATVAACTCVGLAIGALVTGRLPLSPFVVTLGMWGALRGLAKGLGDNQPIYFERNDGLAGLMVPGSALLPPGVWVLLVGATLGALLLRRSVFGRHVHALGSNRPAARLCGVNIARTECLTYVVGGVCAGIAAVLQLSYLSMGDPTTAQGLELKAIAAAVIGGASLAGGEGSIAGTLVGALVMTIVDNGCTKLGLDNWVQEVATGGIIVGAVALDRWRQRR